MGRNEVNRAGQTDGCYIIAIKIVEHRYYFFKRYTFRGPVFTTDIQCARAYKTAYRAKEQIRRIAERSRADTLRMTIARYIPNSQET